MTKEIRMTNGEEEIDPLAQVAPYKVSDLVLRNSFVIRHSSFVLTSTVAATQTVAILESHMTRQQVLDLYFMDARSKLIDLVAFMDRVERASGEEDFRMKAFREALAQLEPARPDKAKQVLLALSDPTTDPIAAATTKAACGAWPGSK